MSGSPIQLKPTRLSRPSHRRKTRILDLIAEGKTNKQIAEAMFLSENTVKNYITGLLRKLKVTSRTEAAIYATKLKGQD